MLSRSSSQSFVARRSLAYQRPAWAVLAGLTVLMSVWAYHLIFSPPADSRTDVYLVCAVAFGTSALCAARGALNRDERGAWLLMALGIACWGLGEVYFDFLLPKTNAPFPSWADAGYLSFYPPVCLALWRLTKRRLPQLEGSVWLNGVIGALAAVTMTAALVFEPLLKTTHGSATVIVTSLAYPLCDLALLALLATVFGLSGWKMARSFAVIGVGLVLFWLSDLFYLLGNADGTYAAGHIPDIGWLLCLLLIALAAWQRPKVRATAPQRQQKASLLTPMVAATGVALLLLYGTLTHINALACVFATATLLCVFARMWQVYYGAQKLANEMTRVSLTDALTDLGNRRALMCDLEDALGRLTQPGATTGAAFVIFDLNGFKAYNDTFGHPAGDELLRRLGHNLRASVTGDGAAYRLGGDEFCVLLPADAELQSSVIRSAAALSEAGSGYDITAAYGVATVPDEARTVSDVMRFADRKMYAQKAGGRMSVGSQMRDLLLSTLSERSESLGEHNDDVAQLAGQTARALGLDAEQVDEVVRAAQLHDVGKVAVPDEILFKPGPLTDEEWVTMKMHTIIGERILAASPTLAPVGKIVRSSHERWDGAGYPDAIAGDAIPAGARIVAVCDAFDAMVTDRVYRKGMSVQHACTELRQCSGTQFDPGVVDVFLDLIARRESELAGAQPVAV